MDRKAVIIALVLLVLAVIVWVWMPDALREVTRTIGTKTGEGF